MTIKPIYLQLFTLINECRSERYEKTLMGSQ